MERGGGGADRDRSVKRKMTKTATIGPASINKINARTIKSGAARLNMLASDMRRIIAIPLSCL